MLAIQIGVFLMLLASAAALAGALALSRRARLDLEHHVNMVSGRPPTEAKTTERQLSVERSAFLDEAVRHFFCSGVPYRWGMRSGGLVLLVTAAVSAILSWFLVYRLLGNSMWLSGLLGALASFLFPRLLLQRQQRRAVRQFLELLPNAIDMIIRMMRAGMPITSAVRTVGTETSPPISSVFASVARHVEIGIAFERALDLVSQRIGVPDFRFFSVAVTLQHSTGGNLAATLEILSDLIRKRRAVRLKASAATAEVRMSAYVLGAIPVVTIGALLFLRPDYVAPLVYDQRGNYILAAAASLLLLAYLSMRLMLRRLTAT